MNIYAVLDESDDESPKVKTTQKKEDKTPAGAKPAAAKKETAAPAPAPAASASKPKNDGAKAKGANANGGEQRKPPARKDSAPSAAPAAGGAEGDEGRNDNKGPRKRREERRGGRGERPNARQVADENAGKMPRQREFDRRSGTGRFGGQKKAGRGAHSFGNVEAEALQAEKDPSSVLPDADGEVVAEAEETPAPEPEPQAPPTLSLDEYMAKRNEARANSEVFGEVKTRAVEVDASLRVKEDPVQSVFTSVSKAQVTRKEQRSTGKTQVLDVGFKSAQPTESTGDRDFEPRGGRGGGRGGRGGDRGERGAGRGGRGDRGDRPRSSGAAGGGARLNLNDSELFPSL